MQKDIIKIWYDLIPSGITIFSKAILSLIFSSNEF